MKLAIESIHFNQTLKSNEIILVEDGPLTDKLYAMVEKLKIIKLEKNMGLEVALQNRILVCSNELIVRMDTGEIFYLIVWN